MDKRALVGAKIITCDEEFTQIDNGIILINEGKIEVSTRADAFSEKEIEGYEIINLQGKTIIPGLVDTHIHFSGTTSNNAIDWMIEENEYEAIVATRQMKDVLSYGFTSVRDISRYGPMLKKAVENGIIIGPRIKTTGRGISRTGGHGDVPGFAPEIVEANHPWAIVADTEQNVRLAVRKQMRNGVDAIKIWASGGGMHSVDKEQDTHFNKREIIAMVEEASQFGLPVIAHCENLESAQICIAAGCASIEHGEELDDWCIEAMKKNGTFFVPTLNLLKKWIKGTAGENEINRIFSNFKKCFDAGIKICVGSDSFSSDYTPYGVDGIKEIHTFVDAGMSEQEALIAATINGAYSLDMANDIGSIEAGKYADLIVLNDNPLDNIRNLNKENIMMVIKNGIIVK